MGERSGCYQCECHQSNPIYWSNYQNTDGILLQRSWYFFDREYAANLGVDVNKLYFAQPDCGEDCLEIATKLISSNKIGICVIDSVAALIPKAELEGAMGDARIGLQARLMSQALRKMVGFVKRSNCCCIFINQIREKIGIMFGLND